MNDKTIISLVAIICLTILEAVNMAVFNIDGALFGLIIAGICGLAGYEIRGLKENDSIRQQ